jgi:murein DD-endopeptidase MepM/ murein hydrolase activator NlpD
MTENSFTAAAEPQPSLADRWFPDRQLLIRGPGNIVSVTFSQRSQIIAAAAAGFAIIWLAASSLGAAWCARNAAAAAITQIRLQNALAADDAKIAALTAQAQATQQTAQSAVAAATRARDAAIAEAAQKRDAAVAAALRDHQRDLAEARAVAVADSAALAQLTAQAESIISKNQAIIRSTGLNPDDFAAAADAPSSWTVVPVPGAPTTGPSLPVVNPIIPLGPQAADETAPDKPVTLLRQLSELDRLSGLLAAMPLLSPVQKIDISSPFGMRPDPWTGAPEFHVGVDLRGPVGTPVFATAPGTVTFAGVQTGYGNLIIVDHGHGLTTRYSHLQRMLVPAGATVALGQEIALLGNTGWSTGPHLLYETRVNGQPENPLNFMKVNPNDATK